MIRKQLTLGLLATLLLVGTASARSTQQGDFDTTGGSGNGHVQSGSGTVATPPPARTPAATRAPVVRSAPTPRVTATPRVAASPVVVTPKPAPRTTVRKKATSPKVRCPSQVERQVLQRRAAGQSVRKIASALDLSRARVRTLQRRAVGLLLADSDPGRCDNAGGAKKKSTRTAASTGAGRSAKVVAPTATAAGTALAPAGARPPANIALTPKDSKSSLFLYVGLGVLALFVCLAIMQTRGKRQAYYR
jgi:hypothetical protein